jgi:hypothetical protein
VAGPVDNFDAPPTVDTAPAQLPATAFHREGDVLVAPREGAIFPARCVRCNEHASRRLMRQLYWHHPALYLLIFISLCIYVIPALILRKKAVLEIGLCERHFRRRRWGIAIGWGGFLLGMIVFIASIDSYPMVGLFFMLVMVVAPIAGIVMAQVISPKHIDAERAKLKVGRPFLESFSQTAPAQVGALPGGPSGTI